MKKNIKNISVIGDGGWGTTLAIHLTKQGYNVTLWGPFPKYLKQVEKNRYNSKFLPGIRIPQDLKFNHKLDVTKDSELIVFAIPSKFALKILNRIKRKNIGLNNKIIVSVTKGLDYSKLTFMSQTIKQVLGDVDFAVLSGPTIAMEVAKEIPSTAVVASKKINTAKKLQKVFNSNYFRIYTNTDVIGVEVGGSVKNIIAIACGVCDGLRFGSNTKSAILTRGLSEMARLGKVLGAKQKTFSGLSGLGDLATTCFNTKSRNRSVGELLGKGKSIKEILASMAMVAEGVDTVKAITKMSKKYKIQMPISSEVYNIIYKRKKPQQAVADLMCRKMKSE